MGELAAHLHLASSSLLPGRGDEKVQKGPVGVIPLMEAWADPDYLYLVFPYANGGELFDYVAQHPHGVGEAKARGIFRGMARALQDLHGRGISHGDVSLENVMLSYDGEREGPTCHLIDLEMARHLEEAEEEEEEEQEEAAMEVEYGESGSSWGQAFEASSPSVPSPFSSSIGTSAPSWTPLDGSPPARALSNPFLTIAGGKPGYVSPEIVRGTLRDWGASDVWSLGICLVILLTGRPLYADPEDPCFNLLGHGMIAEVLGHYAREYGIDLPAGALSLVIAMLDANPAARPTLQEIMAHSWVMQEPTPEKSLSYQLPQGARLGLEEGAEEGEAGRWSPLAGSAEGKEEEMEGNRQVLENDAVAVEGAGSWDTAASRTGDQEQGHLVPDHTRRMRGARCRTARLPRERLCQHHDTASVGRRRICLQPLGQSTAEDGQERTEAGRERGKEGGRVDQPLWSRPLASPLSSLSPTRSPSRPDPARGFSGSEAGMDTLTGAASPFSPPSLPARGEKEGGAPALPLSVLPPTLDLPACPCPTDPLWDSAATTTSPAPFSFPSSPFPATSLPLESHQAAQGTPVCWGGGGRSQDSAEPRGRCGQAPPSLITQVDGCSPSQAGRQRWDAFMDYPASSDHHAYHTLQECDNLCSPPPSSRAGTAASPSTLATPRRSLDLRPSLLSSFPASPAFPQSTHHGSVPPHAARHIPSTAFTASSFRCLEGR